MPVVPIPPKSSVPLPTDGGDSAADVFARAAKERAETTVALDATNQLQGLQFGLSNPDTGYRSLLGGDAVKGIDGQALTGQEGYLVEADARAAGDVRCGGVEHARRFRP